MNAVIAEARRETPLALLPVFTRMLPGAVSASALAAATMALEMRGPAAQMLVPLLWVQILLLALGAMSLVATAHQRLRPWEGRVAPAAAGERVRRQLLLDLGWMSAIALAGPWALAAVLDWQTGELRLLPGVAAMLSAGLCGGVVLGLGRWGRAPRVLIAPALLVLASLAQPGVIRVLSGGDVLQSLALLACAGLLWAALMSPRSLAARARPLPRLQPMAWWRRRWAHRMWSFVAERSEGRKGASLWLLWIWLYQPVSHADRLEWLSWGRDYSHPYAALGYGVGLLLIGAIAGSRLIAPPVHWRHRIAPGGFTVQRWALRLVLGSMLFYAGFFGVGVGLGVLIMGVAFWPVHAAVLVSGIGDLLLATSAAAWLRGRRGATKQRVLIGVALVLAAPLLLSLLIWMGLTPQRGPVWLLLQLALTALFARAAIRAWARRDLNTMA